MAKKKPIRKFGRSRPKKLTTPILPNKKLMDAILELGPGAPWDGMHALKDDNGKLVLDDNDEVVIVRPHNKHSSYHRWWRGIEEEHFQLLLDFMGYDLDCRDDGGATAPDWRRLALELAALHFPGLRKPKLRPRGAPPKVLALVAAQHWNALPNEIKPETAITDADVNRGHFFKAKRDAGLLRDKNWWRKFPPPKKESGK